MDQSKLMYDYTLNHRETFNQEIIERDDNDIIDEIMKVIKSCERSRFYTIKILKHQVIESPIEINRILKEYEDTKLRRNKSSNKKKDNPYDFISLKNSDVKLLIVTYFIQMGDESETFDTFICVPRLIDRYYFRISGNLYLAMHQIVDGSTYNNSNTTSKLHSVTLKTLFQPIRLYRKIESFKTTKKESIEIMYYAARIFNKNINAIKYILGKFGIYETFSKLGINCVYVSNEDPENEELYTFGKNDIFISVPKIIFDAEPMVQALVHTLFKSVIKDTTYEEFFSNNFWKMSLGGEMNNYYTLEKGERICESLEGLLDISTRENLRLPEDKKKDIYDILIWMMREFSNLKIKDNLDIRTKRIRFAEYIASLYAMKLAKGMHRISDNEKKTKLDTVKKAINTLPEYLLSAISSCKLISYKNQVNDMDGISVLKYSYKGIAGIGEKNASNVNMDQRRVHPSFLGNTDPEASSNSDPGLSGVLCPLSKIKDGYFSNYKEPDFWEDEFTEIMNVYKKAKGIREVMKFRDLVDGTNHSEDIERSEEDLKILNNLIKHIMVVEETTKIQPMRILTEGGLIYE